MAQVFGFLDPDNYLYLRARQKIGQGRRIADEELARFQGHHNDQQDGLRHAEWSRRMAKEIDPIFAYGAGAFHELEGLLTPDASGRRQPLSEAAMDMRTTPRVLLRQGRAVRWIRLEFKVRRVFSAGAAGNPGGIRLDNVESKQEAGDRRRKPGRLVLAFVIGCLVGVLAVLGLPFKPPRVVLSISGADVTHAGGRSVVVESGGGRLQQICNGACDDVFYDFRTGPTYALKVQGPDGGCLVCKSSYVDGPWTTVASVAGVKVLQLSEKTSPDQP